MSAFLPAAAQRPDLCHRHAWVENAIVISYKEINYRSRLVISITINRESKTSFFKLAIGVYAAVALSIMALLLDEDFGDRMGIFVGNLFAVIVNMQSATSDLGSTNSVTLIDFIHIIAIIYIFISAILLVYTRFLSESDQPSRYLMCRIAVPILAGSFVVLNIRHLLCGDRGLDQNASAEKITK